MEQEKRNILLSLVPPLMMIVLLWVIKLGEIFTNLDLAFLGVNPQKLSGLSGIITGPLIHADIKHLFANSVPLFVLGGCLFYFYKEIALRVFVLIYFITGLAVWVGAREAYHIGISGVVYGLASFLFFSGIFRRDVKLLAITMLVAFLYGSMVWGIFPELFPDRNISYESHFWGLMTGMILAFYYRKLGPQKKKYEWEDEEDEDEWDYEQFRNDTNPEDVSIKYFPPKKRTI